MTDRSPVLILPADASGYDWEECVRTARDDCAQLRVHYGDDAPLASRYARVEKPVWFAPGSLAALLKAVDQGYACAVPVSNSGLPGENIAQFHADPALADQGDKRLYFAEYLANRFKGQTRQLERSSRFCVASRSPTLPLRPAATLVLDSFVYVPASVFPEDSMIQEAPSPSLPGLCIWVYPGSDPAYTLAQMATQQGMDLVVLNASGAPLANLAARYDVWTVPTNASWNFLAPKLKRWFGDRNVLLLRSGLHVPASDFARMASTGWNPEAPIGELAQGWVLANPGRPLPFQLPLRVSALDMEATSATSASSAAPAHGASGLPLDIQPFLLGFQRLVVSGHGETRDLSGNACPQEGCDAILWKLEPSDIPGLAHRLRHLRLAGCRRLLVSFENNFFQTPEDLFAHLGCSPVDVRREIMMAGFHVTRTRGWAGCATVPYQENYRGTTTSSEGWSEEDKLLATHSRLWMAADACQEAQDLRSKVSVIVLAINKVEYTRKCLESLQENCQMDLELILVNNGSTDGTRAYFDSNPKAKVIHNAQNLGVAAGWNQGMRQATGDYLLILNNDTIVAPRTVENLVRCARNHPDVGMVCPRSNKIAGPQLVEGFAYKDESEIPAQAARLQQMNDLCCWEFTSLKGFCMLIPRNVAQEVGEFDEQFGIGNFEDDDYCQRVFFHGYRLVCADDSFLFHYGSVSFNQANIDWDAQMRKNQALFNAKWGQGRSAAFAKTLNQGGSL